MMQNLDHEKELGEEEKTLTSSECSSGCQSGWTMYLDHSSAPLTTAISMQEQEDEDGEEEEEEEDLSMVSDASSGPPHFRDEDCHCGNGCCFCSASSLLPSAALAKKEAKKRRVEAEHPHITNTKQEQDPHSSLLDDTASSPFFGFSKTSFNATTSSSSKKKLFVEDILELSCGFSATQFKGKSAFRKHLGYFKSCSYKANLHESTILFF